MRQAGSVAITSYILHVTLEIKNQMLFLVVSRVACVAGVIGEGEGERGSREKNEGDWGEGRGNACHKNPIRFISAFAGKRKFLIG